MSAVLADTCGICMPGRCPHVVTVSVPTSVEQTLSTIATVAALERERDELRTERDALKKRLSEVTRAARRTLSVARGELKDQRLKPGPKPKGEPR